MPTRVGEGVQSDRGGPHLRFYPLGDTPLNTGRGGVREQQRKATVEILEWKVRARLPDWRWVLLGCEGQDFKNLKYRLIF
jgi:hypothetical protein